jgi:hypothetical protein
MVYKTVFSVPVKRKHLVKKSDLFEGIAQNHQSSKCSTVEHVGFLVSVKFWRHCEKLPTKSLMNSMIDIISFLS